MKTYVYLVAAIVLLATFAVSASAADLYWNFDGYTNGTLAGQDGWTGSTWAVSDVSPLSGAKSARVQTHNVYAYHMLGGQTFADGTELSFLVKTGGRQVVVNQYTDAYNYVPFQFTFWSTKGILFYYGTGVLQYTWLYDGALNYEDIYSAKVSYDFTNHLMGVEVTNLTTPTQVITSGTYALDNRITAANAGGVDGRIDFRNLNDGGSGWAQIDEVKFTTPVPEPGSIMGLAGGLLGLAGFALRRRR